jgi:hypothetical protein
MSHGRRTTTHLQRERHWRPSAKSLAAAAAASGDPGPLLAVETYELHNQPVARPDGTLPPPVAQRAASAGA